MLQKGGIKLFTWEANFWGEKNVVDRGEGKKLAVKMLLTRNKIIGLLCHLIIPYRRGEKIVGGDN